MNEAKIIINDFKLSNGMSMTIRVALDSFYMQLKKDGLGDDGIGKDICQGYMRQIKEIRKLIG